METMIAENHIRTKLVNDASLVALLGGTRIYNEVAPQGTTTPFIVFRYQASRDINGNGAIRTATTFTYLIEVISNQSFTDIDPIASRMDAVLQGSDGSVTGGLVLGTQRIGPFKLMELQEDGTYMRRLGGFYRVDVQNT